MEKLYRFTISSHGKRAGGREGAKILEDRPHPGFLFVHELAEILMKARREALEDACDAVEDSHVCVQYEFCHQCAAIAKTKQAIRKLIEETK